MRRDRLVIAALIGVWLVLSAAGCRVANGRFVSNSQFVYPNSSVKTLGPARADLVKWSVFILPTPGVDEVRDVYNRALAQQAGANILVNYREDTSVLIIPLEYIYIYRLHYVIEGEAARMEVGERILQ